MLLNISFELEGRSGKVSTSPRTEGTSSLIVLSSKDLQQEVTLETWLLVVEARNLHRAHQVWTESLVPTFRVSCFDFELQSTSGRRWRVSTNNVNAKNELSRLVDLCTKRV